MADRLERRPLRLSPESHLRGYPLISMLWQLLSDVIPMGYESMTIEVSWG